MLEFFSVGCLLQHAWQSCLEFHDPWTSCGSPSPFWKKRTNIIIPPPPKKKCTGETGWEDGEVATLEPAREALWHTKSVLHTTLKSPYDPRPPLFEQGLQALRTWWQWVCDRLRMIRHTERGCKQPAVYILSSSLWSCAKFIATDFH